MTYDRHSTCVQTDTMTNTSTATPQHTASRAACQMHSTVPHENNQQADLGAHNQHPNPYNRHISKHTETEEATHRNTQLSHLTTTPKQHTTTAPSTAQPRHTPYTATHSPNTTDTYTQINIAHIKMLTHSSHSAHVLQKTIRCKSTSQLPQALIPRRHIPNQHHLHQFRPHTASHHS